MNTYLLQIASYSQVASSDMLEQFSGITFDLLLLASVLFGDTQATTDTQETKKNLKGLAAFTVSLPLTRREVVEILLCFWGEVIGYSVFKLFIKCIAFRPCSVTRITNSIYALGFVRLVATDW